MISILSPAKRLKRPERTSGKTQPTFLHEALTLVRHMQTLSKAELKKMMHLSDQLSQLNFDRYKNFSLSSHLDTGTPAYLTFAGDVYQGLQAEQLSQQDDHFAQDHLLILSGLYGFLRPLDSIQAHRLEMGTKVDIQEFHNLYEYWNPKLTSRLTETLRGHDEAVLINLASREYATVIDRKLFPYPMIDVEFKEKKNGTTKVVALYAKKARGMMARFIIQERIDCTQDIKNFCEGGYEFDKEQSTENCFVFTRELS